MNVLVAVLTLGNCRTEVASALLKLQKDGRHNVDIGFFTDVPGESNRNRICKKVVEEGYDYVLMIDNDNPPISNPLDLIDLRKDVIALPTPTAKNGELIWVVGKEFDDGIKCYLLNNKQEGLEEVDAVGSGCLLLSRKVLEEVKAPFMREWNDDGVAVTGQDFAFCKRAKKAGFKIYAHWDYVCSHFKEIDLLGFA
jgi:GT2 family glycosyltransferase